MRVFVETYGCTANQADSQIMAGLLQEAGNDIVSSESEADAVLLNTCYVKDNTEKKIVRRLKELSFSGKKVLVAGCMSDANSKKVKELVPNAILVGTRYVSAVNAAFLEDKDFLGKAKLPKVSLPKLSDNPFVHIMQINEGCVGSCNFCVTKLARGQVFSFAQEDIVKEVKFAVESGAKEILLTSQDTGAYGLDFSDKSRLPGLLGKIVNIPGDFRVRVGMMNPDTVVPVLDDLIDAFKSDKIYKFLHIPVQSGSDKVLKDMNRAYSVEEFELIVSKFRKTFPNMTFATDVILGYPTESEEDFQLTCELVERIGIDVVNSSLFSPRPKTFAATLVPLSKDVVKSRGTRFNMLTHKVGLACNLAYEGRSERVLVTELGSKGGFRGRTLAYKPVIINADLRGGFVDVVIKEGHRTWLEAQLL